MTVTGTLSGNISSGSLVGGRTGGTLVVKVSAAAVTIKVDLPVLASPATTRRTPPVLLPPGFHLVALEPPPAIQFTYQN